MLTLQSSADAGVVEAPSSSSLDSDQWLGLNFWELSKFKQIWNEDNEGTSRGERMTSDFFVWFYAKLQRVSCHFVASCVWTVEERARHELQNFVSVRWDHKKSRPHRPTLRIALSLPGLQEGRVEAVSFCHRCMLMQTMAMYSLKLSSDFEGFFWWRWRYVMFFQHSGASHPCGPGGCGFTTGGSLWNGGGSW